MLSASGKEWEAEANVLRLTLREAGTAARPPGSEEKLR